MQMFSMLLRSASVDLATRMELLGELMLQASFSHEQIAWLQDAQVGLYLMQMLQLLHGPVCMPGILSSCSVWSHSPCPSRLASLALYLWHWCS